MMNQVMLFVVVLIISMIIYKIISRVFGNRMSHEEILTEELLVELDAIAGDFHEVDFTIDYIEENMEVSLVCDNMQKLNKEDAEHLDRILCEIMDYISHKHSISVNITYND